MSYSHSRYRPRPHSYEYNDNRSKKMKEISSFDLESDFVCLLENSQVNSNQIRAKLPKPNLNNCKIEIERAKIFIKLRSKLEELIRLQFPSISVPKMSFERWILERRFGGNSKIEKDSALIKISNTNADNELIGTSLRTEILDDIPYKANMFPSNAKEAKQNLLEYMKHFEPLLQKYKDIISEEEASSILSSITLLQEKIDKNENESKEFFYNLLVELKNTTGKHLQTLLEPVVNTLCITLLKFSNECYNTFHEQQQKEENTVVERTEDRFNFYLRYEDTTVKVSKKHYEKLELLFSKQSTCFDRKEFEQRLFCLLLRYNSIDQSKSMGLHAALPDSLFQFLHKQFSVSHECFASPFNCYFKSFCSAYYDTDYYFGSVGSFFDFHPTRGSFEANPPFVVELMDRMVTHIENLLNKTEEPLSFCIIGPYWSDAASIQQLEKSKWTKKCVILEATEHTYIAGNQHLFMKSEMIPPNKTIVAFLQNEKGFVEWNPSDEKMEQMKMLWKSNAQAVQQHQSFKKK